MDDATTWKLIHAERSSIAATLSGLTPGQWASPSLCGGWSVQETAGHIVNGAEQTAPKFVTRLLANGFRFNTMINVDAKKTGTCLTDELVDRLQARTTTTNHPPAPAVTMLGEVVVHAEDIRLALGIDVPSDPQAVIVCLDMFSGANFPVGTKKRIAGLRLVANDMDWASGTGPEVSGPGKMLLSVATGRAQGLSVLGGEGLETLHSRMPRGR